MKKIATALALTILLTPIAASAHKHRAARIVPVEPYHDPADLPPPAHQQVFESDVTGVGYPDAIGTPTPGQEGLPKRCRTWNGQYEPPKGC